MNTAQGATRRPQMVMVAMNHEDIWSWIGSSEEDVVSQLPPHRSVTETKINSSTPYNVISASLRTGGRNATRGNDRASTNFSDG
eukprot:CAMPEP_0176414766 /NCGR_PEP_ID=MMETSP0127-20121128/5439_1 /TAXON_ID=938130 /ORGANISM="Platyophrya macrostoma, Strain WH" /LENGTH=83 /DNA_ID=CAMNT_0017794699 /DNA_START=112 /DNA_END=363 /DNA_ORIENTATION=-